MAGVAVVAKMDEKGEGGVGRNKKKKEKKKKKKWKNCVARGGVPLCDTVTQREHLLELETA